MSPRSQTRPHWKGVHLEPWQNAALSFDLKVHGYRSVQDWLEDAVLAKLAPSNAQARKLLELKQEQRKIREGAK